MIVLSCESVRERLPELLAGTLEVADAGVVRSHLAECDDCAADLRLIEALRAATPRAPASLAERVASAVAMDRRAPTVLTRRRVLLAAAAAAALLAGSMLYRAASSGSPSVAVAVDSGGSTAVAVQPAAPALDGAALMQAPPGSVEADGLSGDVPSLDDLSASELQSLLTELSS